MSVHYEQHRDKYVVREREDGRNRSRRFADEAAAEAFDARVNPGGRAAQRTRASRPSFEGRVEKIDARRETQERRGGGHPYATNAGVRWRFVYRQSDGSLSSRRGFTSRGAAVTARRRLLESVDRGEVKVGRENFGAFWERFCAERRAYMTAGSHVDLRTHGRKRQRPGAGWRGARSKDAPISASPSAPIA